jgi:hypothetical protein
MELRIIDFEVLVVSSVIVLTLNLKERSVVTS